MKKIGCEIVIRERQRVCTWNHVKRGEEEEEHEEEEAENGKGRE